MFGGIGMVRRCPHADYLRYFFAGRLFREIPDDQ
jgi:hypothetical protein